MTVFARSQRGRPSRSLTMAADRFEDTVQPSAPTQPSDDEASACGSQSAQSREALLQELHGYRAVLDRRDSLIRRASAAGISEALIARITGHSRTTVRTVLGRQH